MILLLRVMKMIRYILTHLYILYLEFREDSHQRYIDNHKYYVMQSKFNLFQLHHMMKKENKND